VNKIKKRREIAKNPPKQNLNQKPELSQNLVVKPTEKNPNLTNNKFNPTNDTGSETASKSENTMKTKAKKIGIAMVDPRKSQGLKMIKKMKNKPQNILSCKKCGAEINEEQKFCKKCGEQLFEDNVPVNKKKLKEYMRKRLGKKSRIVASEETRNLFGPDVIGRSCASEARKIIKRQIRSGEIKTFKDIDNIIEMKQMESKEKQDEIDKEILKEKERVSEIRENIKKIRERMETEPTFTVFDDPGEQTVTYEEKGVDWSGIKRTGNIIGGTALFGPTGALLGASMSNKKDPKIKTKTKKVHNTQLRLKCLIDVRNNRIEIIKDEFIGLYLNDAISHYFKYIADIKLFKEQNKFIVYKKNGWKVTCKLDDSTKSDFLEKIFNEIKTKFEEYNLKNETIEEENNEKEVSIAQIKKLNELKEVSGSENDPIAQIKKLNELKEEGILTDEEFEKKKQELLERI
jgi:hypothetical protein